MKVLALTHEGDAGPGVFADVTRVRGAELHEWRIADGERCPGEPSEYDAVLVLGGSMDAHEQDRHPWLAEEEALLHDLIARDLPVLGVCLGAQVLARATGGHSSRMSGSEIGWHLVELAPGGRRDPLLGPLGSSFHALQWHSCQVTEVPGAESLARNSTCLQAFRVGELAWGILFHAEVTLADFESWIDSHLAHPGDGDGPEDPEGLRTRTRELIAGWNSLGRGLFGRFLDQAAFAAAVRG